VIENKPGAGTNIALRALIDSLRDGCALMVTTLAADDVKGRPAAAGGETLPGAPDRFAAFLNSERVRYQKLVRGAKTLPD
jgi:tripartite-type tricarboxylate transporter receptor subunit TctC